MMRLRRLRGLPRIERVNRRQRLVACPGLLLRLECVERIHYGCSSKNFLARASFGFALSRA